MKNQHETTTLEVAAIEPKQEQSSMQIASLDVMDIGQLDSAETAPVDLMSDYWTPENIGDFKRVIFDRIGVTPVLAEGGEILDLECAFFFVNDKGAFKQLRNGSKRLVGALQAYDIKRGAALEIKYMGKKQNRINSFKSDNWSIKPLVLNAKAVEN